MTRPDASDAARSAPIHDAEAPASRLSPGAPGSPPAPALSGASPLMARLRAEVRRLGPRALPVLVQGESGTGKERVARALHEASGRSGRFVGVNCAALPDALLESELFGSRRGAWTGAVADRVGLFVAAQGGTLLLDEVGDASPALQAKLLRVLQEREVRPVGDERARPVNVRVLAATHRDLAAAVRAGRFRSDLYFRLAVLVIHVPPLRARRGDVGPLAQQILARCAERAGRGPACLSPGALRRLEEYAWPGNVRELENALQRSHALADGAPTLNAPDLALVPDPLASHPFAPAPLDGRRPGERARALRTLEREAIEDAMARAGGTVSRAAAELGIHRATLYRKLKRLGLTAERART